MDEVNTIENHDPDLRYLKKPWKGVAFCDLDLIRSIHAGEIGATAVVWPDEGKFEGKLWHFNEKHEGFEPLLIDRITAGAMISVHDNLKPENQAKLKDWVQRCRGHFAKMYELCMENVTFSFMGRK
ncbi:hypothetical protein [Sinorhizobium meliloti]|uniref:hypothetical protein n=1 Tax=Rhizobium meliloti TaxID=382 RepID=UPI001295C8C2|nr:hypothetical protein [Sinorhizobium meliloti]MDW9491722.1 hypothetical protein [Sinorhizobium meliloti]MQV02988.1 hypothetical protein [Sinorhizobium meliloti]